MAQLFEKALIVLIVIIAGSLTLTCVQQITKEIEGRMAAGACEALASKLLEASYTALTVGRAEVVFSTPSEVTVTFSDEMLIVSSHGYVANRSLPARASEFSRTFSGQYKIILEARDGVLWVGEP